MRVSVSESPIQLSNAEVLLRPEVSAVPVDEHGMSYLTALGVLGRMEHLYRNVKNC